MSDLFGSDDDSSEEEQAAPKQVKEEVRAAATIWRRLVVLVLCRTVTGHRNGGEKRGVYRMVIWGEDGGGPLCCRAEASAAGAPRSAARTACSFYPLEGGRGCSGEWIAQGAIVAAWGAAYWLQARARWAELKIRGV